MQKWDQKVWRKEIEDVSFGAGPLRAVSVEC